MLPFTLSFLDDVVPDNYRLLYKDWGIQKFVISNRIGAFGKDGA